MLLDSPFLASLHVALIFPHSKYSLWKGAKHFPLRSCWWQIFYITSAVIGTTRKNVWAKLIELSSTIFFSCAGGTAARRAPNALLFSQLYNCVDPQQQRREREMRRQQEREQRRREQEEKRRIEEMERRRKEEEERRRAEEEKRRADREQVTEQQRETWKPTSRSLYFTQPLKL